MGTTVCEADVIEVAPRLYVSNEIDYRHDVKGKDGWSVLHACKEPYHREAVGYAGRGLTDRDHPEYLYALRDQGRSLCLNIIDAPKPEFFRPEMIDRALAFIKDRLAAGDKVLVHCNQGGSRAPSLALLYMRRFGDQFADMSFEEAEDVFRASYRLYQPAPGIRAYVEAHWDDAT